MRIRVGVSPLVILHFKSLDRARAWNFHGQCTRQRNLGRRKSRIGRGSWKEEGSGRASHRRATLDAEQGSIQYSLPSRLRIPGTVEMLVKSELSLSFP